MKKTENVIKKLSPKAQTVYFDSDFIIATNGNIYGLYVGSICDNNKIIEGSLKKINKCLEQI